MISGTIVGMPTLRQDLTIPEGARFRFVFQLSGPNMPSSLVGYTASMQIRPYRTSDELYASWASPGEISVNDLTKQLVIDVDEAGTADLDFTYGEYDLELHGDNGPWRIAEGIATLSREVTRA